MRLHVLKKDEFVMDEIEESLRMERPPSLVDEVVYTISVLVSTFISQDRTSRHNGADILLRFRLRSKLRNTINFP